MAALTQWPQVGVPRSPEAWLLTAAKRRLLDGHRRRSVREGAVPQLEVLAATAFPRMTAMAVMENRGEMAR